MGNGRNLVVLGVVLVVLGGLYALTRDRRPELDTTGGFVDLVPGKLSTDDVHQVEFALGEDEDDALRVVKNGDDWVVASRFDAPANLNKVRTLLGNLESVEGEVRSNDPSVLDAYALDDSNAYHLSVKDESGDPMAELLIGKRSGAGCFVRKPGDDQVLIADHNFLSDFGLWSDDRTNPDPTSWMDLVAFKADRDSVTRLEIHGDQTLVLEKKFAEPEVPADSTAAAAPSVTEYDWHVLEPTDFMAARSKADAILNSLTSVRARNVIMRGEAPEEYGLGDKARRVVVTTRDGESHTLLFGAPLPDDENLLYFEVEGNDLIWSLPSYLEKNVFKSPDDLKA